MKIKIKRLHPDAKLPSYAHEGDVGMDLFSLEDYELKPMERRIFSLGFALEFPTGFAAIVKDKGSLPKIAELHTLGEFLMRVIEGNIMLILSILEMKIIKSRKDRRLHS